MKNWGCWWEQQGKGWSRKYHSLWFLLTLHFKVKVKEKTSWTKACHKLRLILICPHPLGSLLLYEITAWLAFLVCACYQAIRSAGRVPGCLKLGASDETAGFSEPESHWRILSKDPACLSSTQACGVHTAKWSFLFGDVWLTDTWRRVSLP